MEKYSYKVPEKKFCVFCETYFDDFNPWQGNDGTEFVRKFDLIGTDPRYFQCPVCGSTDRERHLYLFLRQTGELEKFQNKTILLIAPEINFLKKIYKPNIHFICGDLHPEKYINYNINPFYKVDLTKIPFDNDTFDYVIANHVLEHIKDYRKALTEIYRVLKNNGTAILQTPFSHLIYENFEDVLIDNEKLKIRFYGQEDHERIFGLRLFDDIQQAGFRLDTFNHYETLKDYDPSIYGLNFKENLILARK